MKAYLLCLALVPCRMAAAQSHPVLPPLPEASLQTIQNTTTVNSAPGVRYQYQLVHLEDNRIWLAPAWRGQAKLEPARKFLNPDAPGELDGLLLKTINELAADGWDLLEIRSVTRPTSAVQKVEKDLQFNDPNRPVYTGTTSVSTTSETRYLFRRALPR